MKPQGPKGCGVHQYLRAPCHFHTLEHGACDEHRCIKSEVSGISGIAGSQPGRGLTVR